MATRWPTPPAICRRSVYERELKPKFSNQKLVEITHEDLRALADAIVERGAPATAVHVREIVLQVFRWAIERGQKVENPAELVRQQASLDSSHVTER
ncbi:Prophage CP4-57 integrase [Escherichia coli]|nr:Prophage CP4-57 integrase [Escherichia coli]